MRTLISLALIALLVQTTFAQGNSWDRVRYNGGTLQTKVDPKDWDNRLTVTSDLVTLELKDGQKVEIPAKKITALSYGQEAHRRVGTMVALGVLVAPIALFGLFHKTRLHFIGIEFTTLDGKGSGVLIQGHKDNYRAIMTALEAASGAPVSVSEKDREFVPGLANAQTVKEGGVAIGGLTVTSTPDSADVFVDGTFKGNTPSTLKLSAGKHMVKVASSGYKDWEREIDVTAGSDVKLNAKLEK
jgi:hypothetical protein